MNPNSCLHQYKHTCMHSNNLNQLTIIIHTNL